jgi:hypothetical protein
METANLGIRFLLELCALAALGYWGWQAGGSTAVSVVLAVAAPLAAALLWGCFVAPKRRYEVSKPVKLGVELLVFAAAVTGLVAAGAWILGLALGLVYAVNRLMIGRGSTG